MVKLSIMDIAKGLGVSVSTARNSLRNAGISMVDCDGEMVVRFLAVFDNGFDARDLRRMRDGNRGRCREIREARRNRKKGEVPKNFLKGRPSIEHDDGFVEDVVIEADDSFQEFDFE